MLDSELLLEFAETFCGYGDLSAPLWFIGMEEAGGGQEDIQHRLDTWRTRGRRQVEDAATYHEALGIKKLTSARRVRLQPTWAKLIYLQIAAEGGTPGREDVRRFQKSFWGRENSSTCLLELMPLPKRAAASWKYNDWTNIPELWSRSLYFAHFAAKRAEKLRFLVSEYQPKAVVFYGKSPEFACHWPWIASVKPDGWQHFDGWREAERGETHFMIAPDPVAHASQNALWSEMGHRLSGVVRVER